LKAHPVRCVGRHCVACGFAPDHYDAARRDGIEGILGRQWRSNEQYSKAGVSCLLGKSERKHMKRRIFVGGILAGLAVPRPAKAKTGGIPTRVLGKTGEKLTIAGEGGSALSPDSL
jgi:hypothetical protein